MKIMKNEVTFKVEKNERYGDFRVVKYVNNQWYNERDNNWTKKEAEEQLKKYENQVKKGFLTMGDTI